MMLPILLASLSLAPAPALKCSMIEDTARGPSVTSLGEGAWVEGTKNGFKLTAYMTAALHGVSLTIADEASGTPVASFYGIVTPGFSQVLTAGKLSLACELVGERAVE